MSFEVLEVQIIFNVLDREVAQWLSFVCKTQIFSPVFLEFLTLFHTRLRDCHFLFGSYCTIGYFLHF